MTASRFGRIAAIAVIAAGLAACAAVPEEAGFTDVEQLVADRAGHAVVWHRAVADDPAVRETAAALLAEPIDAGTAVQVALLNNRGLQARFERLGIAQADVVEAGLLANPVLSAEVLWSSRPDEGAATGFGIAQSLLGLLMRPARQRLAGVQFEEAKLEAADAVLDFAAEVAAAFYVYQAAEQAAQVFAEVALAAELAYDFARRLDAAGNISELALAREQAAYEQARIALDRAQGEAFAARERLTRLMGLWAEDADWEAVAGLPDPPLEDPPLGQLESLAIANNLRLATARRQAQAMAEALGVVRDWRWLGEVEIGVSTERETDGQRLTGPSLALALPLFDQGQARIARGEARLRGAERRLEQMAVEIRSEVRDVRDRLIRTRRLAEHYRDVVVPLNQRIVALAMEHHGAMLIGAFEVLADRRNEMAAYRNYIDAVRDYWIARTDLDRILSGQPATAPLS